MSTPRATPPTLPDACAHAFCFAGDTHFTQPGNVKGTFTPPQAPKIYLLIHSRSDCSLLPAAGSSQTALPVCLQHREPYATASRRQRHNGEM